MIRLPLPLLALALLSCSGSSSSSSSPTPDELSQRFPPPAGAIQLTSQDCPAAATHVYHPQRLFLLAGCQVVGVRGSLQASKPESDGDYHVQLKVDADEHDVKGGQYINARNHSQQRDALVLEPVCDVPDPRSSAQPLTRETPAQQACGSYLNPLKVPAIKTHVVAYGYWMFDSAHGWNELHPLTAVTIVPAPTASASPTTSTSPASSARRYEP